MHATRLRSQLATVEGCIADRHFNGILVQGLPENYRDVKLNTNIDPNCCLKRTRLRVPGRAVTNEDGKMAGRGTATTAAASSDSSSISVCRNFDHAINHKNGCAVSGKVRVKFYNPAGHKSRR